MSIVKNGKPLPHIPWEDAAERVNRDEPLWRYSANPIIPRDLTAFSNSIFNSAVVPFNGEFAGVFRCDDTSRRMNIHAGRSKDGINWTIIETTEDWLLFYHGVLTSCNGFVYSFGAALLDPDKPYELAGDVPNVTFPCAALVDGDTGRLSITAAPIP
jgi:predicted GH43/DUF377 family glycosyl hydrolase